jgi:copper chaperone CopZ
LKPAGKGATHVAKIEQVGLTVQDNAIHCGGCESRIETVLKKLPGVMKVKADHKTQKVSITLDTDKTLVLEVTKRLEAAGYRAS